MAMRKFHVKKDERAQPNTARVMEANPVALLKDPMKIRQTAGWNCSRALFSTGRT